MANEITPKMTNELAAQTQLRFEKGTPVVPISSNEPFSEYTMDDGAVIRVKMVLLGARRLADDEKGVPEYAFQFSPVFQVEPPKKPQAEEKK